MVTDEIDGHVDANICESVIEKVKRGGIAEALNKPKAVAAVPATTLVMSDKLRLAVGEHSNALTQHSCDVIGKFLNLCDKPVVEREKEAEAIISACGGRTEGKLKIHESTTEGKRSVVYMRMDYRSFTWQKAEKTRKTP